MKNTDKKQQKLRWKTPVLKNNGSLMAGNILYSVTFEIEKNKRRIK
jgi:hypothetical protein